MGDHVFRFDSLAEYTREAIAYDGPDSWHMPILGLDREATRKFAVEGDPTLTAKATAMLDGLAKTVIRGDMRAAYVASVAGTRVNVPDYLSGSPTCMRRRVKVERPTRCVRIYFNATATATIPAHDMLQRGVTVLALLEYLQSCQVSVELYLTADGRLLNGEDVFQAIRVESMPPQVSDIFAIAHPAYFRRLMHGMCAKLMHYNPGMMPLPDKQVRRVYNLEPNDIYIPYLQAGDPIICNPGRWLRERISQLAGDETA